MLSSKKTAIAVKKTHSVKNNILSLPDRRVIFLSQTYNGSVHDKKICDEQPLKMPTGTNLWQDTGFLGHAPKGVNVQMPMKRPKGKELTTVQKEQNRKISRFRVLVEHAICGAKRCRIVKERLRCHKNGFDDLIMELACGLHNYRISIKKQCITY